MRQVQPGQTLTVTLDALPGRKFDGKVLAVNPLIDAAGRSVVIRAIVRNADTSLRPGMFTRVNLITQDQQDALVIPEQAIVPQGDEQFVFRIVDGKAARVKVDIGQRRDGKVEVLKGLDAQRHGRHRRTAQASRRHAGDDQHGDRVPRRRPCRRCATRPTTRNRWSPGTSSLMQSPS